MNACRKTDWQTSIERAEVFDDEGNIGDYFDDDSFRYPYFAVYGGVFHVFPRRARMIGIRFFTETNDGTWTNAAEFRIQNPFYAVYPQWRPEPWPVTHRKGDLSVTLEEFRTGVHESDHRGMGIHRDNDAVAPHNTVARFSIAEKGRPSDDWRLENLVVSDATGNRMSRQFAELWRTGDRPWTRPGTLELAGALWPGESAWRLQVEVVRKNGVASNDLWTIPLAMPHGQGDWSVTNRWEHPKVRVDARRVSQHYSARDRDVPFWVDLAVEWMAPGFDLAVAGAVDQNGKVVPLLYHEKLASGRQSVFLRPGVGATNITLTLSVQRPVFVEFTARPEFPR